METNRHITFGRSCAPSEELKVLLLSTFQAPPESPSRWGLSPPHISCPWVNVPARLWVLWEGKFVGLGALCTPGQMGMSGVKALPPESPAHIVGNRLQQGW